MIKRKFNRRKTHHSFYEFPLDLSSDKKLLKGSDTDESYYIQTIQEVSTLTQYGRMFFPRFYINVNINFPSKR